jgi:cytochrome c
MTQPISRSILSAAALLLAVSPLSVMAADGASLYKTKTCSACHGKDAKTPLMPNYPKIAGQSSAYTLQQMKDIKSGARNNGQTASMKGVMHLVTDEEMQVLADYLATMTP